MMMKIELYKLSGTVGRLFLLAFTLIAITMASACDEVDEEDKNSEETPSENISLSVDKTSIDAASEGGTYTVAITSNTEWTAEVVTENAVWCTISPAAGTGNGTITVTVDVKPKLTARGAVISVKAGNLTRQINVGQQIHYVVTTLTDVPAGALRKDAAGNVYVSNTSGVQKITSAGTISTLGNSILQGASAVDAAGNVYKVVNGSKDNYNNIRKITPEGVESNIATNIYTIWDVVVDGSNNVYVANGEDCIRKITPEGVMNVFVGGFNIVGSSHGYVDGTGKNAKFDLPGAMTIDAAGNIYVADVNNYVIRKVTPAGVVTTLAGSGKFGHDDGLGQAAYFGTLSDVDIDASGNVYVLSSNSIRKITAKGLVSTVAGGGNMGNRDGIGTQAQFASPYSIAVVSGNIIYVSDTYNAANMLRGGTNIRKITRE